MTDRFTRKTFGRIFVGSPDHIEYVHEAIKRVDEFEAGYMPDDIVAVYDNAGGPNPLVYLHKFEIDKIELAKACMAKGVWIWCVDNGRDEFDLDAVARK